MTELEAIAKLEPVFAEIATLEADIKEIKDEIKEADLDATLLATIAKAKVQGKLNNVEEKCTTTLKLIDTVMGN